MLSATSIRITWLSVNSNSNWLYRLILLPYIFPGWHELRLKGALMNLINKKFQQSIIYLSHLLVEGRIGQSSCRFLIHRCCRAGGHLQLKFHHSFSWFQWDSWPELWLPTRSGTLTWISLRQADDSSGENRQQGNSWTSGSSLRGMKSKSWEACPLLRHQIRRAALGMTKVPLGYSILEGHPRRGPPHKSCEEMIDFGNFGYQLIRCSSHQTVESLGDDWWRWRWSWGGRNHNSLWDIRKKTEGVVVLQRIKISKKFNDTKFYTFMYHVFG